MPNVLWYSSIFLKVFKMLLSSFSCFALLAVSRACNAFHRYKVFWISVYAWRFTLKAIELPSLVWYALLCSICAFVNCLMLFRQRLHTACDLFPIGDHISPTDLSNLNRKMIACYNEIKLKLSNILSMSRSAFIDVQIPLLLFCKLTLSFKMLFTFRKRLWNRLCDLLFCFKSLGVGFQRCLLFFSFLRTAQVLLQLHCFVFLQ